MVALAKDYLGVGLYSISEVALYARVSKRLANRWFFGTSEREPTLTPTLRDKKFISFLDFIQMVAIRDIRNSYPTISLKKVRQLLEIAEKDQGISHPFATKGVTFFWNNNLGLKLPNGELLEASGSNRRSMLLKEVVTIYKEDLGYNAAGLADLYKAFRWNGEEVVNMRPAVRFGEPIVTSCGYSAQSLWRAAQSEGSFEAAARAYGVSHKDVEAAFRYYDHLNKANEAA